MPTPPPSLRNAPSPAIRPRDTRPSANARGYSARWQRYAAAALAARPLCARCEGHGVTTLATLIDHIRAVQGEGDPGFWDADNHQPLCRRCHAIKTHADRRAGTTRKGGR